MYSVEKFQKLVNGEIDYVVCDDVIVDGGVNFDEILNEGINLHQEGYFKAAGVGKNEKH